MLLTNEINSFTNNSILVKQALRSNKLEASLFALSNTLMVFGNHNQRYKINVIEKNLYKLKNQNQF